MQSIQCRAVRDGDDYVVNGTKMWVTNGLRAGLVVLLCKTDPKADPPYKGISVLYVEKEPEARKEGGLTGHVGNYLLTGRFDALNIS